MKRVGDEYLWVGRDVAIPAVLGGEDQERVAALLLPDAQGMIQKRLHQRPQQQFLVRRDASAARRR